MAESSSSNLTKNTICSNLYDEGGEENHETQHDELKRGPWSLDEDSLLIHYIACHGEGRWNLLADCSGLKRTGKSCRLRWLNYLKPDVKRGNLSIEEQILIIELQSKMGNRWSKIAKHLPGRTDNEIKNYWRTRVQKLERRRLKIDNDDAYGSPSVPRLIPNMEEVIHSQLLPQPPTTGELEGIQNNIIINHDQAPMNSSPSWGNTLSPTYAGYESSYDQVYGTASITSANDSFSCLTSPNCYNYMMNNTNLYDIEEAFNNLASTDSGQGLLGDSVSNCHLSENNWAMGYDVAYDLWK